MLDRSVFWQFHHPGAGPYTKFESRCMFPYGDERESFAYTAIDHEVRFVEEDGVAVPRLAEGRVPLTRPDGGIEPYTIEPISYPVYLRRRRILRWVRRRTWPRRVPGRHAQ